MATVSLRKDPAAFAAFLKRAAGKRRRAMNHVKKHTRGTAPPKARRQKAAAGARIRQLAEGATPTWQDLVDREPELASLLELARTPPAAGECPARRWDVTAHRGIPLRERLRYLVGWARTNPRGEDVLYSAVSHELAAATIQAALPACLPGCSCSRQ